jgi:peptidoglycan/xylan/chitin deacetylase (PgdA/CDA1 family)
MRGERDGQFAMKKAVLKSVLRIAKAVGLFALARRVTARDLRILCYHGAELRDEHHFRPGLFMSKETFAARMDFLARHKYPVLSLDEAVASLGRGGWPNAATVITIDDGWFGTYKVMAPILWRHGFPATLYIASYYLEKRTQVFNVAADYVLWRARDRTLDLSQISGSLDGSYHLANAEQRAKARDALVSFAERLNGAEERQELFRKLCGTLGLDSAEIERERICAFMSIEEARDLQSRGIDIQLHTHRHRFPSHDIEAARAEIDENRRVLAQVWGVPRRHFCYPSGEYEQEQLDWLKPLGIDSATTTKSGFTRPGRSPYELSRFLDSEKVSALEFEAEMCGLFELIRRCGYAI